MPHLTSAPIPMNTRVVDRDGVFTVPGTIVESNDMTSCVEWDDGAGFAEIMFNTRLEPFRPQGSAR